MERVLVAPLPIRLGVAAVSARMVRRSFSVSGAGTEPDREAWFDRGVRALAEADEATATAALLQVQGWPELTDEGDEEADEIHAVDAVSILFYALDHQVGYEPKNARWAVQRLQEWADLYDVEDSEANIETLGNALLALVDKGAFDLPLAPGAVSALAERLAEPLHVPDA